LRCAAALSTAASTDEAIDEVVATLGAQCTSPIDLAFVFASTQLAPGLAAKLSNRLETANLVGCAGEAIVGSGREIEGEPALAVWVASLPGAIVEPTRLEFVRSSEGGSFAGWPDGFDDDWPDDSSLLVLADPFSFPADALVERLNEDRPGLLVAGGMASGGYQPGQNRLWLGGREWNDGAVAVRVHGAARMRSVVSQGCRPIGRPLVVTRAERNTIFELSGKPALSQFSEVFNNLPEEDQQLVRSGLHLGRVVNEYQDKFARGDFLVRNVTGADRESGAIVLGDYARVGQTVQFHVRDAKSADEDLRELLTAAKSPSGDRPAGALVFTCNGRGTRLFESPHHDAAALEAAWPGLPVAGFFAQGEIGPVGGHSFLHGFTASIVLVESVE
jgi:small ligand-binding sensory domain FIST